MRGQIHRVTLRHFNGYRQVLNYDGSGRTSAIFGLGTFGSLIFGRPYSPPVAGQTVTGMSSGATALIEGVSYRTSRGYLAVNTITGVFSPEEMISTPSWSATLLNQGNHLDSYGSPIPAVLDTIVECRMYTKSNVIQMSGQSISVNSETMIMLPPTVEVQQGDTILSTVPEFSGEWQVANVIPRSDDVALHHYTARLGKVGA